MREMCFAMLLFISIFEIIEQERFSTSEYLIPEFKFYVQTAFASCCKTNNVNDIFCIGSQKPGIGIC